MTRDEKIAVLQAENTALQTTLAAAQQTIQQQEVIRRLEAHMAELDQVPEDERGDVRQRRQTGDQKDNASNGASGSTNLRQVTSVDLDFAAARRRLRRCGHRLLDAEGGAISLEQTARTLHTTPDAIEKRRQEGALLGLRGDHDGYVYPVWQFDHGKPFRGLDAVLHELHGVGPWMRAAFMLTGDAHLNGEPLLDILRRGEIEAVIAAAREYGEQGGG